MHQVAKERSAMTRALQAHLGWPTNDEKGIRLRLSRISDLDVLASMLQKASSDSRKGELIEARMAEVLRSTLPHLFCLKILAGMLLKVPHESRPEQLIEMRIREVLRSECDFDVLTTLCRETYLYVRQLVRQRIREVLPEILPGISDFNILADMLQKTPSDSYAKQLIKSRMSEVIEDVTLDTVDEQNWFLQLLFNRTELPRSCQVVFREKVCELSSRCDTA